MKQIKHWKGFEELENHPDFAKEKHNEFRQQLPIEQEINGLFKDKTASRRDFLKVLGFSLGAATIAASCEIPVRKAIPYVFKPEEITPGIANYYATSYINGTEYNSILVKTREGRPIKIEGNELSSLNKGGTTARAQASVISLYDTARLTNPRKEGKKSSWADVDKEITAKLATASAIAVVTPSVASPGTKAAISEFQRKYPNSRHVVFDAISYHGIAEANQQTTGRRAVPAYNFAAADVIVSINADFLGTWVAPVEFTQQYTSRRKLRSSKDTMNKHWQFESYMSITGAKADVRTSIKPSEIGTIVAALYNEITGANQNASLNDKAKAALKKVAAELKTAGAGKGLVVCGSNDVNIQLVVNAINDALGAYGSTITNKNTFIQSNDKEMAKLVADMNSGAVDAVILWNVNPGYNYPDADQFLSGIKKAALSVSLNERMDETAEACQYQCPDNHYLESWGDAEPVTGYFSLQQPTISRLFNTRQMQESLLAWAGNTTNFYTFLQNYWQASIFPSTGQNDFQAFWDKVVHDGVYELQNQPLIGMAQNSGDINAAMAAISGNKMQGVELSLIETIAIGDGRHAANPFLQEAPDPISKICWDNCLAISQKYAKEQGWEENDIIEVSLNNKSIELPLIFQPGVLYGTVAIALGYGRTKSGNEHFNNGKNAFPFVRVNNGNFEYTNSGVTLKKVGTGYKLPRTQTHHTIDDKRSIIRETTLTEYQKDAWAGNHDAKHFLENADHLNFTLYGPHPEFGPHEELYTRSHDWEMSIDLTACTGCNACVVSCHLENNVPMVGHEEVFRVHEMHWLRLDRYYATEVHEEKREKEYILLNSEEVIDQLEHPQSISFMPMLCQHCDNAPCENVCPVAATNHSSEGINQMAYNRCIGTRYCANNCPFKVRRFNWYDYQGADSFYKGTIFDNDDHVIMDDLTRMVLNPDVTVRSRGVMEKCSFCIQRIQEGKLKAKRENRPLLDGEVKTACQAACAAGAIVFGDANNKDSELSKLQKNERSYRLLEELHVVPSVGYMTIVRNREALHHDNNTTNHG
ncbi:MAG: TAT-variant-translocated molybdopterin oxidoreductase [Chitinophagales bacterium]|jgi:MoCo/4Fe-4S cofactor protein with predicted Tat translocation signal|nr:TAT-variant-translocated molybdopterin oxidoreductase [Sphingobacteriales bacterium]MBP9141821.1 TAT-variant-translocated molybdopterin oxidoreductase [Chitinophagales bacterium]MDA0198881.1 TAT-variant-translocated molybdopterin oxidoreductase [Bacteroidota bacterium]MBK8678690.1 TAT-variant-translocated molybdopterin oxidoreductase [Sphingobacteriales bacterium]MBL0247865.1 TAT-variant-translocated molybdopterin oxidoreductase [Sphingobacteriales bacterium]